MVYMKSGMESGELKQNELSALLESFSTLRLNEIPQVQVGTAEGIWKRDSTVYDMRMLGETLTFSIPNDAGTQEYYESVDNSGKRFRNRETNEMCILRIHFPER